LTRSKNSFVGCIQKRYSISELSVRRPLIEADVDAFPGKGIDDRIVGEIEHPEAQ